MAQPASGSPRRAPSWRARFLGALAESSNVRAAAQHAGISLSRVYRAKAEDRAFAEAWLAALCEGYDRLELELLARLRSGEASGGARAGEEGARRFDNATALRLLLAHRETRARHRARQDHVSAEQVRASIEAKLARLREQVLEREAAEREAAAYEAGGQAGGDGG